MEIILLVILGIIAIAEIVAAIYAIKSHIYAEQINILTKQLQGERNSWIEDRNSWIEREGVYVKEIVVLREWVKKYLSDEEKITFQAMFNEEYDKCVNKKIIK